MFQFTTICACRPPAGATGKGGVISVNYDGFIDDVSVGDELLVDGGIISFVVRGKTDTDVQVTGLRDFGTGVSPKLWRISRIHLCAVHARRLRWLTEV